MTQTNSMYWVLGGVIVTLVIVRLLLQSRARSKSPLQTLARNYLVEQLQVRDVEDKVPPGCITEVAALYADHVESLARSAGLRRLPTAALLVKNINVAASFIAAWVKEGKEVPQTIVELAEGEPGRVLEADSLPDILKKHRVAPGG